MISEERREWLLGCWENEEWKLWVEMRGDEPVAYRYGPEWVGMQLFVDGGYKTPEEAKLRWLEYWEAHGK